MADVDRFLLGFFRASERRASPGSCSIEPLSRTREERDEAGERYDYALLVVGSLTRTGRLSQRGLSVLRAYYLSLTQAHRSIVARRWGGEVVSVTSRDVPGGGTPDEAADLQSYCDWPMLAYGCLMESAAAARVLWSQARAVVAEELARRGA